MHGELVAAVVTSVGLIGSSPRAWGTLDFPYLPHRTYRFIPTCMGNSSLKASAISTKPVHPHVHGELFSGGSAEDDPDGSSPRAWGTHPDVHPLNSIVRFIPTCMGNSELMRHPSLARSVHPHVHGELEMTITAIKVFYGSSPRAWGTRFGAEEY